MVDVLECTGADMMRFDKQEGDLDGGKESR